MLTSICFSEDLKVLLPSWVTNDRFNKGFLRLIHLQKERLLAPKDTSISLDRVSVFSGDMHSYSEMFFSNILNTKSIYTRRYSEGDERTHTEILLDPFSESATLFQDSIVDSHTDKVLRDYLTPSRYADVLLTHMHNGSESDIFFIQNIDHISSDVLSRLMDILHNSKSQFILHTHNERIKSFYGYYDVGTLSKITPVSSVEEQSPSKR